MNHNVNLIAGLSFRLEDDSAVDRVSLWQILPEEIYK